MAYWEAHIAFVVDQPLDAVNYLKAFVVTDDVSNALPHPWTGISTSVFVLLAQTGILVRHRRMMIKLGWSSDVYASLKRNLFQTAVDIELCCLGSSQTSRSNVKDLEDSTLSYSEFEQLDMIYQLAVLLELYRAFPELCSRSGRNKEDGKFSDASIADMNISPSENSRRVNGSCAISEGSKRLIFEIATNLVSLCEEIGTSSRAYFILPLALIIGGSVMQDCSSTKPQDDLDLGQSLMNKLACVATRPYVMLKWRNTITEKFRLVSQQLGMRTYQIALQVVERVWERAALSETTDGSDHPVLHWIDIMEDLKFTSFFG